MIHYLLLYLAIGLGLVLWATFSKDEKSQRLRDDISELSTPELALVITLASFLAIPVVIQGCFEILLGLNKK